LNAAEWLEYVTSVTVDLRDCYEIIAEFEEAESARGYQPSLDDVVSL